MIRKALVVFVLIAVVFSCTEKDDISAPDLNVNGNKIIYHVLNKPYTDPGASAYDAKDQDVNSSISTEGTVDVNLVGDYTITYQANDENGNIAEAIRIVKVYNEVETFGATFNVVHQFVDTAISDVVIVSPSSTINNRFMIPDFGNSTAANINVDMLYNTPQIVPQTHNNRTFIVSHATASYAAIYIEGASLSTDTINGDTISFISSYSRIN